MVNFAAVLHTAKMTFDAVKNGDKKRGEKEKLHVALHFENVRAVK